MIALLCAAAVCFVCGGGLSLLEEKTAYDVVLLGDSVIGNQSGPDTFENALEAVLGVPVLNGAFGGSSAAFEEKDSAPANVMDQFGLVKVAQAITRGDYGAMRSQQSYGMRYFDVTHQVAKYFIQRMDELEGADYSTVKYLVIEHGTNDYNSGVTIDNPLDKYDVSTYAGALRYSVELLQEAYPDMRIILMTPTWCYFDRDGYSTCEDRDWGGGLLAEYVEAEKAVAEEYGLVLLDNYTESGINGDTASTYLLDGVHMTPEGQALLVERLAALIQGLEGQ